mgnify:CR=1 FL=1
MGIFCRILRFDGVIWHVLWFFYTNRPSECGVQTACLLFFSSAFHNLGERPARLHIKRAGAVAALQTHGAGKGNHRPVVSTQLQLRVKDTGLAFRCRGIQFCTQHQVCTDTARHYRALVKQNLQELGFAPGLAVILGSEDPGSVLYRNLLIKDGEEQLGTRTKVKVVKNKVAPPFKRAEFDIMFGEGISKMSELIDLGVKLGIVQKSGAWFNYGDIRLGQGRDNAKQFLRDNPEIANDIEGQVRANADKLYATRRPGGKAAAAPAEGEPAAPATAKEPVVKAPARSSESELDIMVEE